MRPSFALREKSLTGPNVVVVTVVVFPTHLHGSLAALPVQVRRSWADSHPSPYSRGLCKAARFFHQLQNQPRRLGVTTQQLDSLRAAALRYAWSFIRGLQNSFLTKKTSGLVCAGKKEERSPKHVRVSACAWPRPYRRFECVHSGVAGWLRERKPLCICAPDV